MSAYFMAIDCGTSCVKCLIIDENGNSISFSRNIWDYIMPPDIPFAVEFDPKIFWKKICNTIEQALKYGKVSTKDITAISTTSQRYGAVFLDSKGNELYAGPNMDVRGVFSQDEIIDKIGERIYDITGKWPPFMFTASRLLWFRENKPEIYQKIRYALTINDWVMYKLTNIFSTTPSTAAETMIFDLSKREWSSEIIDILNFSADIFPPIFEAGRHIGEITKEAEIKCSLLKGTPVIMGGGDTQCGLLGMGVINPGQLGIVSGMTTPLELVTSEPLIDSNMRTWTSCHIIPNQWIIESNTGMTGGAISWFKNKLSSFPDETNEAYDKLDQLASNVPPCSEETLAFVGPEIMDCKNMTELRPTMIIFPRPTGPATTPVGINEFARAILENIAFAIKGNYLQLEEIYKKSIKQIYLTGGMSKMKNFLHILADVLACSIKSTIIKDGSSVGCAVCAAVGSKNFSSFKAAAESLVNWGSLVHPNDERIKSYRSCYNRWNSIYKRLAVLEDLEER